MIKKVLSLKELCDGGEWTVSDGYHTFDELYEHRFALFLALCQQYAIGVRYPVWRSQLHDDGSSIEGWFVMGIGRQPGQQITYHLPIRCWEDADFAETLDRAPAWDGHTSQDVIDRIKLMCL